MAARHDRLMVLAVHNVPLRRCPLQYYPNYFYMSAALVWGNRCDYYIRHIQSCFVPRTLGKDTGEIRAR